MAKRPPKKYSLSAKGSALVDKLVRSGRYPSETAVVSESVRLLFEHEKARHARIKQLRRELEKGSRAIARGEVSNADDVFAELDRREAALAQRRRRKSA